MTDAKSKLMQMLTDAPKRVVQIDGKLHVILGVDTTKKVDSMIKRALADGKTVTENGVATWVECWAVRDSSKPGSAAYTWKDGNTLRVERIQFTKSANGEVTKKSLGFGWRDALSVL